MGNPFGPIRKHINTGIVKNVSIPENMGRAFGPGSGGPYGGGIGPGAGSGHGACRALGEAVPCFNSRDNGEPFRTRFT